MTEREESDKFFEGLQHKRRAVGKKRAEYVQEGQKGVIGDPPDVVEDYLPKGEEQEPVDVKRSYAARVLDQYQIQDSKQSLNEGFEVGSDQSFEKSSVDK